MQNFMIVDKKEIQFEMICPFCYSKLDFDFALHENKVNQFRVFKLRATLHCVDNDCSAQMSLVKQFANSKYSFSDTMAENDTDNSREQLRDELSKRWGKWMENAFKMRGEINDKLYR